jgi:signal transduction histidine kinase
MSTLPEDAAILLARESQLADLGELAGPLTHEFNNVLNNLNFQLEIIKQAAPEAAADQVTLRNQLRQTAALIARFQHYRSGVGVEVDVDLNGVLRRAVEVVTPTVVIATDLADDLPPVRGHPADVLRLCRFLLNNAVRSGGAVTARTSLKEGSVELQIEDDGPSLPAASLPHIFEPGEPGRVGMCGLELAACRSIMRRLRGRIEARLPLSGGLLLVVTFAE